MRASKILSGWDRERSRSPPQCPRRRKSVLRWCVWAAATSLSENLREKSIEHCPSIYLFLPLEHGISSQSNIAHAVFNYGAHIFPFSARR